MSSRSNIPKSSSLLVKRLLLVSCFCCAFPLITGDCKLVEPTKEKQDSLAALAPLRGLVFETEVLEPDHYTYKLSICDKMEGIGENIGAIQFDSQNNNHTLGRYNVTDVVRGTNWILLTYHNGSSYGSHCTKSGRTTKIMIICNPSAVVATLQILEERKSNFSRCYYLFELSSNVSCTNIVNPEEDHGFSSGTVFCILFFTGAAVYLICGFLYKRIVVGTKGMEQIPNYTFWTDFGNLQADGCDYFCRWGPRRQAQAYRGIDEHLRTEEERDDQLLNM